MRNWSDERIAEFWESHDSTDYVDHMEKVEVHVDAPADYRVISMRLESEDVDRAKHVARSKGIPYTVLLRMWIKEKLEEAPAHGSGGDL